MNLIKELLEVRSIGDLKDYWLIHKNVLQKAALVIIIVAAIFVYFLGKNDVQETAGELPQNEVNTESSTGTASEEQSGTMFIDISGCVFNPGVYEVPEGTRIFQVIERAGGLTSSADITNLNRAEPVSDGQKIVIYSYEETAKGIGYDQSQQANISGQVSGITQNGLVNINLATSEELQTISGIGPSTASKIIDYRDKNGKFNSVDELKNVSGIGDKTFEKLKPYITV